jgi:hypothetical protein
MALSEMRLVQDAAPQASLCGVYKDFWDSLHKQRRTTVANRPTTDSAMTKFVIVLYNKHFFIQCQAQSIALLMP